MADRIDILLEEVEGGFDLAERNGDFDIGESTEQNMQQILLAKPGYFKQFPEVGVDIEQYINDDKNLNVLKKQITEQLEADGMKVVKIDNNLIIEAYNE